MTELVQRPEPRTTENRDAKQPKLGDWFHVTEEEYDREKKKNVEREYLRCITHIGTNYIELKHANKSSIRIHFDFFDKLCRSEPEAEKLIDAKIEGCKRELRRLMGRVKELTASLAITPQGELAPQQETAALVLQTSTTSMKDYKVALIKAQEEQLPELFEEIKETNERMAMWMKAPMLPMMAQVGTLDGSIDAIKQRVFNVELYAGLVEEVTEVRKGEPAAADERVRLLQRRHYMDEECLVAYECGGMEFGDIGAFNAWIAKKENFERVLPFPRCAVAFRVRRNRKYRAGLNPWIAIKLDEADKRTFLYLRNGERLHMISTEIDFDSKLFPDVDRNILAYGGTLWAKGAQSGKSWIKDLITNDERDGLKEALSAENKKVAALKRKHKKMPEGDKDESGRRSHLEWLAQNGVNRVQDRLRDLEPFTPESVYFDDISGYVRDKMLEHNRIVLILQGLFDRSPVFHPHPQYKLWEQEGYEAALELVYDDSRALTAGDKPDFGVYVEKLRKSIAVGSIVIGQEDAWMRREAKRENNRYRSGRRSYDHSYERYRPYGDPGPGFVARVEKLSRDRSKVTFRWTRARQGYTRGPDRLPCVIEVPVSELFNISAYEPGDFRVFFADPRSRADYLDWAPFLLTAEDWHAGKVELGKPGESTAAFDLRNIKPVVEEETEEESDE